MAPQEKFLKVLHIRSSGSVLGAENVVIEIAKESQNYGVESIIGIPVLDCDGIPEFAKYAESNQLNVKVFNYPSLINRKLPKDIKEYVNKNNIDVIHCHGYQEDFYAWMANTKKPLIATNHLWKRTTLKLKLYMILDALILKRFNHIIAVSKPILKELHKLGFKKNKTSIIANGVNCERFKLKQNNKIDPNLKQSLNIPETNLVLGMISSLTVEKGHIYALEAFKQCLEQTTQPLTLLIIGDGSDKDSIKNKVKELQLTEHVIFTGTRKDIPEIFSIMDIYLLTSLNEGLPISLLEAMASQLPIISTNVGDINTVIKNEINGFLVESKDILNIRNSLLKLINDTELRIQLAKAASKTIENHYSSSQMSKAYCELYKKIASK